MITSLLPIYFPIAEIQISAIVVLLIGFSSGIMSGLLGIGGGFISTPLLTAVGVPPSVAVATSAHQIVGTSFSSILPRIKPKKVDFKLGFLLAFFGVFGSLIGLAIFEFSSKLGNIDIVISGFYIILMTFVSFMSFRTYFSKGEKKEVSRPPKITLFMMNFATAGVKCSAIIPILLGIFTGILVVMMGVGGGFILVPAMVSIMKIKNDVAVGTSLLQILIITTLVVLFHIFKTGLLDIMLGTLLIVGSAIGSQISSIISLKIGKRKVINLILGLLTLTVALHFSYNLLTPKKERLFIEEYYE
jgi:uncharacterized membrane protein YfcA